MEVHIRGCYRWERKYLENKKKKREVNIREQSTLFTLEK